MVRRTIARIKVKGKAAMERDSQPAAQSHSRVGKSTVDPFCQFLR